MYMKLGTLMKLREDQKDELAEVNEIAKTLRGAIEDTEERIKMEMQKQGLDKNGRVSLNGYTAYYENKTGIEVENWDKVYGFIFDERAAHLLHKRLKQDALAEMVENNQTLPGATLTTYPELVVKKTD